jgi:hypothetical protein
MYKKERPIRRDNSAHIDNKGQLGIDARPSIFG